MGEKIQKSINSNYLLVGYSDKNNQKKEKMFLGRIEEIQEIIINNNINVIIFSKLPSKINEIINIKSLNKSNKFGSKLDRSELCSRYIRTHRKKFKIFQIPPPKFLKRNDLRLTVDYPEDLI